MGESPSVCGMETVLTEGVKQLPALCLNGAFLLWLVSRFLATLDETTKRYTESVDQLSEAIRAGESCGYYRETRDGRAAPRG